MSGLGRLRTRPRSRRAVATASLAVVAVVVAVVALGLGDYPLSPPEVLRALLVGDGFASTIVLQWRLPRVLAALVFGAALGASGAVFQSLTRNPLGSPDVIGFSTGAYTGAIVGGLFSGQALFLLVTGTGDLWSAVVPSTAAALAGTALGVLGVVVERWDTLPPQDGEGGERAHVGS